MNEETHNSILELQCRMDEEASVYEGTMLDPLHQFICGKISFEECVGQVTDSLVK